ncbi:MAG: hypothetical protein ACRENP_18895 [Longimicrobiales bacterium]
MSRAKALLLLLAVPLAACEDPTAPAIAPAEVPNLALVDRGVAYTQIDAQVQRLYDFNNCLTGIAPYSGWTDCQAADMTYDAASQANYELSTVFIAGMTTSKSQALSAMNQYLALLDQAYGGGRLSCRGLYATRALAVNLRTIINAIAPGVPVDLTSMPQPLNAPLWTLQLFAGANNGGTACGPAPASAFPSAGGFTLLALNTSCSDRRRSLDLRQDEFYGMKNAHSNASLRIRGDDGIIFGSLTYRCSLDTQGSSNGSYGSGPTLVTTIVSSPLTFNPATVPCTYSRSGNWNLNDNGPWWVGGNSNSRRLNPGVYCSTGNISLTRDDVQGSVTLIAGGRVDTNADSLTLRAFHSSGVLFHANSGSLSAVEVDGDDNSFAGYIYVPDGRIDVTGRNFTLNGSVVAERIRLNVERTTFVTRDP